MHDSLRLIRERWDHIPTIAKDLLLLCLSIAILFCVSAINKTMGHVFAYSKYLLFCVLGLMLCSAVVNAISKGSDESKVRNVLYVGVRNVALYGSLANLVMAFFILTAPLILAAWLGNKAIVLGIGVGVIVLYIASQISPIHKPVEKVIVKNGMALAPTLAYATMQKEDLKRLYVYQSARILMMGYLNNLPLNHPLSVLDRDLGHAAVFSKQNKALDKEDLGWWMMFCLIGPAAEQLVFNSASTISTSDMRDFERFADEYLLLTRRGYCSDARTESEQYIKQSALSVLYKRINSHCHMFLRQNKEVLREVYHLIKLEGNETITYKQIQPCLDKLQKVSILPGELSIEYNKDEFPQTSTPIPITSSSERKVVQLSRATRNK